MRESTPVKLLLSSRYRPLRTIRCLPEPPPFQTVLAPPLIPLCTAPSRSFAPATHFCVGDHQADRCSWRQVKTGGCCVPASAQSEAIRSSTLACRMSASPIQTTLAPHSRSRGFDKTCLPCSRLWRFQPL